MTIEIYKTALAVAIGGGKQPLRSAALRLATLWAGTAVLSIFIGNTLSNMPLNYQVNTMYMVCTFAFVSQMAVAMPLLSAIGVVRGKMSTYNRLLSTLPLCESPRLLAYMLPSLVIIITTVLFIAYPLWKIALVITFPALGLVGALLFGIIAALGLAYGMPHSAGWLHILFVPLLLWCQYRLLGTMYNMQLPDSRRLIAVGLLMAAFALLGLLGIHGSKQALRNAGRLRKNKAVGTYWIPTHKWFPKKLMRAPTIRLNFTTTFLMSCGIVAISMHFQIADTSLLEVLGALLIAAFCADTRTVCKRDKPFEIVGIQGVRHFVGEYISATIVGSLLAISPILLHLAYTGGWRELAANSLPIAIGIGTGIFAGTVIAAKQQDIIGQSAATLLSAGIIAFTTWLTQSGHNDLIMHSWQVLCCMSLFVAAFIIEKQRNNYFWRKYA